MFLHIIEIAGFKHLRGHIFVLDAVVGQQCGRGRARGAHAGILFKGALCQRVGTVHHAMERLIRHAAQHACQIFCIFQKDGHGGRGQGVGVLHHVFCG